MSKLGRVLSREEADAILGRLRAADPGLTWIAAGSYRRGSEKVNDLDLVVQEREFERLCWVLEQVCDELLRRKKDGRVQGAVCQGVMIELYDATAGCFGATLLHATGSKEFNVECRKIAKREGRILSQYGLRERATGERLDDDTEEGILKLLGLPWVPPEER